MVEYQVRLRNGAGAVVAMFDDWERLYYQRKVNQSGSCQFKISGDDSRRDLFVTDGQLEIWRHDAEAGINWYCDAEFLCRTFRRETSGNGLRLFTASGTGYLDLLARRLVLPAAGSELTSVLATAADSAIVTLATNNAGSGAAAPRQTSGLTISAASGTASAVTRDIRRSENLLRVIQELATAARNAGVGVDFDIMGPGRDSSLTAAQFKMTTYVPYLGSDRTVGNGVRAPVIFALERDNMGAPQYIHDRAKEITRMYVGGAGEGAARIIQEVAASAESDSTWNRIEAWLDAHDQPDTNALTAAGNAVLRNKRSKKSLSFDVIDTQATRYGRDWFLGDRITGRYDSQEVSVQVSGLTITVDKSGEKIDAEIVDA